MVVGYQLATSIGSISGFWNSEELVRQQQNGCLEELVFETNILQ